MKQILCIGVFLCFIVQAMAQAVKTNGISAKPFQINFSDPSIPDFDVHLTNLDQRPIPSAEYGNLKEELNAKRNLFRQNKKNIDQQARTRGAATNPAIVKSAQGNTANSIPNDNDIAVSNAGMVVSVVNSNIRVYDDTFKTLFNKSLTSLVASAGVYSWISDPRVLYDPSIDRFVLVCFSGNLSFESTILVGFTQTNDPTGVWNFYTLNGNSFNDSTWSDYPIIALSDKDLFMTFNQVKDSISWTIGFKQSVIWQIDKQTGFTGAPLQYTLWSDIKYNGVPLRNICPAKYQSATMGNNMYFLTLRNVAPSNDSIFLTEITNSYQSGTASIQQKVLQSPVVYGFPPNAVQKYFSTQPQQYLMTNDARVLAAIYENDNVHFGANSLNPTYMNAGVLLGRIKNISGATPTVTAAILSNDTIEYGYPSMAYMGNSASEHNVLFTFSHCYVDSFPGTSIVYRDANDNYSDVLPVKNGQSNINVLTDSTERWGDYTNIQKKYNTANRAYLAGSWGKGSGMNSWLAMVDNQDFSVGLTPIEKKENAIVYPNPTNNLFNVKFTMDRLEKVRFDILDMQGRLVQLLLHTAVKQGENTFSFSTLPLAKGNYVLSISSPTSTIVQRKLVVQ